MFSQLYANSFWKKGLFLLVFTGAIAAIFPVNQSIAQKRNPYKLPIGTSKKDYKKQVKANSTFQMVELEAMVQGLEKDIRYQTDNNFTGKTLYKHHQLYLRAIAARQLVLVQDSMNKRGLTLLIYDAYRPYATTLAMWEIVPDDRYAANPANGSGHNRGIAIDLTLADRKNGVPLKMPTHYDNFSDTAHNDFMQLDSAILANRALLKGTMEHFGFVALETEWWHFYLPNTKQYPLMDFSFRQLKKWTRRPKPQP